MTSGATFHDPASGTHRFSLHSATSYCSIQAGRDRAARATHEILPAVVRKRKRDHGRFDINISHAVHAGAKLMAVMEDGDGITVLRAVLEPAKELRK